MKRAWPLTPLLLLAASVLIAGAGNFLYIRPILTPAILPDPAANAGEPDTAIDPSALAVLLSPADSNGSVGRLLAKSPFSPSRASFDRHAPLQPAPAEPQYNPVFVGLLGFGETARAMVIWNPGEPAQVHTIGDHTPWGTLMSASSAEIAFDAPEGQRKLNLF